jgi:DNA-binding XRE family transcriptional regulator
MSTDDIRARRVACGLTQEGLAALADVSPSTVRNMEKGRVQIGRLRDKVLVALDDAESDADRPSRGPALLYLDASGIAHAIDAEQFDPATLSGRDRTLCRALLALALDRLGGAA